MNSHHFESEMRKVIEVFGKTAYAPARMSLIHRECNLLPDDAFTRIVNRLIGECRHAPLVTEFRDAASQEREKLYSVQKKEQTRDSWEFWKGSGQATSSGEEQAWMFQAIRMRIKNEMPDEDWAAFMKLIESRFGRQVS